MTSRQQVAYPPVRRSEAAAAASSIAAPLLHCSLFGRRGRQFDVVSMASSRSTAVAATFWLVVLLGNNLPASVFAGRRERLRDLYSTNGK